MSRIYLIFLTRHKLFQLECEVSSDRDNEGDTQQNEDDEVHERVSKADSSRNHPNPCADFAGTKVSSRLRSIDRWLAIQLISKAFLDFYKYINDNYCYA